jgi:hypothetical protein
LTLGAGRQESATTLDEWFDPPTYLGLAIFLTILGLVGVDAVSVPLLPRRK